MLSQTMIGNWCVKNAPAQQILGHSTLPYSPSAIYNIRVTHQSAPPRCSVTAEVLRLQNPLSCNPPAHGAHTLAYVKSARCRRATRISANLLAARSIVMYLHNFLTTSQHLTHAHGNMMMMMHMAYQPSLPLRTSHSITHMIIKACFHSTYCTKVAALMLLRHTFPTLHRPHTSNNVSCAL